MSETPKKEFKVSSMQVQRKRLSVKSTRDVRLDELERKKSARQRLYEKMIDASLDRDDPKAYALACKMFGVPLVARYEKHTDPGWLIEQRKQKAKAKRLRKQQKK